MSVKADEIRFPKTLLEATKLFADEENAWLFAVNLRWPDGPVCPFCGGKDHSFISTRKTWQCKAEKCCKQFSVKKGSIFEDSPIKMEKWLISMWLICSAKNGISSYELSRSIGVTQTTAWFMLQRIRLAMKNGTFEKLADDIEADETFIGGKARNMHKHIREERIKARGPMGKSIVMGMLERGGEIRAHVIPNTDRATLHGLIRANVYPGARVHTDAWISYSGLSEWFQHQVIDHAYEYVNGTIHTNGLENFWSLLKRTLSGTYVSVEPFHLHRYLDEQSFRFNTRKWSDGERFTQALSQVAGKRLTYSKLTGKELAAAAF